MPVHLRPSTRAISPPPVAEPASAFTASTYSAMVDSLALATPQIPSPSRVHGDRAPAVFGRRPLLSLGAAATLFSSLPAMAEAAALTELVDWDYGYRLSHPSDWSEGGKPVKTHMHERLLSGTRPGAGIKLGVTVDPVKIDSLEAFGTLDQVTERVLGVEKGRDGVKSVTLRSNTAEAADPAWGVPSYYTIEYVTESSRGDKLFSCKYCIANRQLYVLQMQAKVVAFDAEEDVRNDVRGVVRSFAVAAPVIKPEPSVMGEVADGVERG